MSKFLFRIFEYKKIIDIPKDIRHGFFSDTTSEYVNPAEPEPNKEVRIKFRTVRGSVDGVYIVIDQTRMTMSKKTSDLYFDFYEVTISLKEEMISYYFEIQMGDATCFYDYSGVNENPQNDYKFRIIPGFSTPGWAKGAVFYQIYVDRFRNGDISNDVITGEYKYTGKLTVRKDDWYSDIGETGIEEFYGGDLSGVLEKMDYLQDLGIEAIYFNPLFVSPSNHKYDVQDYDHIDPHFGKILHDEGKVLSDKIMDNSQATRYINRVTDMKNLEASDRVFIEVVKEAHKRGIKVIIDGVFNHCGSFHKWLDRERIYEHATGYQTGAYIAGDNTYHNYFYFHKGNWPYNNSYEGWWNYATLPKLNYDSKELYDYVMEIARKWISPPYNADGWRLDVAADLGKSSEFNHQFWKDFRKNIKEVKKDALILAEHYGDPSSWLSGKEWDSVMNYDAFMEPVTWFLTGMQKHGDEYREDLRGNADAFWQSMHYYGAKFSNSSLDVAMNELSNHDHSRFLTRTNHKVGRVGVLGAKAAEEGVNKAVMREAVMIQMTWPGAPTIYYGDEASLCGFTDPDNRRTYPWGREDMEMIRFHKELIRIHKENKELRTGSIKPLYSDYNVLAYGRMQEGNSCVVIVNNNDKEVTITIPVWDLGIPMESTLKVLYLSEINYDSNKPREFSVVNGSVTITLSKLSAIILKYSKNSVARITKGIKKNLAF